MKKATRATAFSFLRAHSVGILATRFASGVSTSPVTYVVTDGRTLKFVTRDQTAKVQNITSADQVAFSVVDEERQIAVNIRGKASIIDDIKSMQPTLKAIRALGHKEELPVMKYRLGDYVVVEIFPSHIQYTNFSDSKDSYSEYINNL